MYTSDRNSLSSMFTDYAYRQTRPRNNRALAGKSSNDFLSVPVEQRDMTWLGQAIQRCPGYSLDEGVLSSLRRLSLNIKASKIKLGKFWDAHAAQPELKSAPFPLIWLEYKGKYEGFMEPSQGAYIKNGYLFENFDNRRGLRIYAVAHGSHNGIFPETNEQLTRFEIHNDNTVSWLVGDIDKTEFLSQKTFQETAESIWNAVLMMMILKSRTPLLKLQEPTVSKFKHKKITEKIIQGRPANKPLGVLTFDIARTLAKGRAKTEDEARRFLEEQIVIGHFKLREVSKRDAQGARLSDKEHALIWWSEHFRGGTEEEKAARKDQPVIKDRWAQVIQGDPRKCLLVPGYSIMPRNG